MAQAARLAGTIDANAETVPLGDGSPEKASFHLVQLVGTFTGTIQFEATLDGVTYVPVVAVPVGSADPVTDGVTSATAAGLFRIDAAGLTNVQCRSSAWTLGSAAVYHRPVIG